MLVVFLAACSTDPGDPPVADPSSKASPEPPTGQAAPEGIEGVIAVDGLSNDHTRDAVDYPNYPPLGGDHFPAWITCGYYDVALPDEAAVHSLEHGAIWIAYDPEISGKEKNAVQALVASDGHVLAAPYAGLRAPIVLTAWERQLDVDSATDPRVQQFIDAYVRAGASPEPGVTCADGITP